MIKEGQEIKSKDGRVLAIANRDLHKHQIRKADDLLLPDGSPCNPHEIMPEELVEALSDLGMAPI